MSHGGFGGGGHGHSGFGHGGHHGGHVGHGVQIGHGLGLGGGHHGTLIGHVLHALGLGHHAGHHHGVGAGHHPDQGPTWNQAMQGEKRPGYFLRVDKRPFTVLFLLVFSSFAWLWIVYNVHHAESSKGSSGIDLRAQSGVEPVQPAAPASSASIGTYANAQQYGQEQTQAMQSYASQYMTAATASGAAQMYGMASTGYGGTMAPGAVTGGSPYGMSAGYNSGFGVAAGAPASPYGTSAAFPGRAGAAVGYYPYGPVQTGYAPTANGRARLVVAR